jgi:hypothetical protein
MIIRRNIKWKAVTKNNGTIIHLGISPTIIGASLTATVSNLGSGFGITVELSVGF